MSFNHKSHRLEFNPPMEKNKDNITREELQKREQDTIEILTQRLASYKDQTEPLLKLVCLIRQSPY